jgi:pilus assembly protein FimV
MSALMSPAAAMALGLGEIRMNSALNQPFDAEIELVAATPEDLAALRASLASSETFARYGLDRPPYLSNFTFRVATGGGGGNVIRISSPGPVTEPFVTLLVEATWPRGRLLREYTVLLDPPIYAPTQTSVPVAAPSVAAPRPAPAAPATSSQPFGATTAPAPTATRSSAPPPVVAKASIDPGSTYRVRPNDTLWKIASAANPGSTSDVNRAMVSIFQANPQAFDGNINVLRAGSLLQIPDQAQMAAISATDAANEVARQYRLWRDGTVVASEASADAGRLKLVTPDQGTSAASTATVVPAPGEASEELQARVEQLEGELAEARRLLEVRNAELATLQGQVPAAEAPAAAEAAAEAAVAEATTEGTAGSEDAAPVQEPVAVAEPEPAEQATTAPAAAAEPQSPGLLDRLAEYWWVLVALVAALLGGLLFMRSRRERDQASESLEEAMARREASDLRSRMATKARDSEILVEEKLAQEPAVAAMPRAAEPTRKPVSIEDTLSGEGPLSIEAGDPLAEADFHMAYGLYDQAADLVQLAIKREPLRRDLKLKLLEIFFVWGNRDRFIELAREMNATRADGQSGEWDKIVIMGKQLAADDPLFAGAVKSSSDLDMELARTATVGALDMDLAIGDASASNLDFDVASPEVAEDGGLDFVLDEPTRGADEDEDRPARQAAAAESADATAEVEIENLGLDSGALEELEQAGRMVGDTIETEDLSDVFEAVEFEASSSDDAVEDLLSSTSIIRTVETTEDGVSSTEVIEIAGVTGEVVQLTEIDIEEDAEPSLAAVDFSLGDEAATMSEVGTKLDLARAYIDMGDPEGARSILEEVLQEGNSGQKREANRLMANLP